MSVITDLIDENSECHRRIAELEARIVWLECEAKVNAAPVVSAEQQGVALSREACVIALRLIHRELETLANGSAIERFKAAKEEFSAMLASAPAPSTTEGQGDE